MFSGGVLFLFSTSSWQMFLACHNALAGPKLWGGWAPGCIMLVNAPGKNFWKIGGDLGGSCLQDFLTFSWRRAKTIERCLVLDLHPQLSFFVVLGSKRSYGLAYLCQNQPFYLCARVRFLGWGSRWTTFVVSTPVQSALAIRGNNRRPSDEFDGYYYIAF
jgi:hypothetical protein